MTTVAVSDLVAVSKIQEAANSVGVSIKVVDPRNLADTNDDLFIVDFMDPYGGFYVARMVKNANSATKVVGFYPHIRGYMKQEAEDIGCVALTNAEFFAKVKDVLRGKL